MLMDALKAFINGLFWENFNATFMKNIKKLLKKLVAFLFSHKKISKKS